MSVLIRRHEAIVTEAEEAKSIGTRSWKARVTLLALMPHGALELRSITHKPPGKSRRHG